MRWRVLVSAPYLLPEVDRFRPRFAQAGVDLVVADVVERLDEAALLQLVGDIDGAICGDDQFTARVIGAAPRLRVISKWGTGIDSIDRAACAARGIRVCNTPDAFSAPVADTVLGYVLCFARSLLSANSTMKAGHWHKPRGRALHECVLGIIGVGHVGKCVVRRAVGFGLRVLGNDLVAMPADFLAETGIAMVPREQLLREADFISLNCDLNPTSFHLLDEAALQLVRAAAVVINTARGPVIDEAALARALLAGRLGGAALDVFEVEPLPATSPLRSLDNVLLAPHCANGSPAAWERVHVATITNLLDALAEKSP
jgi:D-3-phosphoglycerate dehydrogenase